MQGAAEPHVASAAFVDILQLNDHQVMMSAQSLCVICARILLSVSLSLSRAWPLKEAWTLQVLSGQVILRAWHWGPVPLRTKHSPLRPQQGDRRQGPVA